MIDWLIDWLGKNLLNDPIYNKGLAFSEAERDRLDIRGNYLKGVFTKQF